MKWLTWPLVVLIIFGVSATLGVSMWAIHAEYVPPAFLFGPLGVIIAAIATAIGHRLGLVKGYDKGLNEMPPLLEGAEIKVIQTLPPPTLETLTGGPPVPPEVKP
jgi:hypothetical protein